MIVEVNPTGLFAKWCRQEGHRVPKTIDTDPKYCDPVVCEYLEEVVKPIVWKELVERDGI